MKIFSAIYGCYYNVVEKILKQAQEGMTKREIDALVQEQAFGESSFHLLPKLYAGEWDLLTQKEDGKYYSKPELDDIQRPMTHLEKSWIKALLADERMNLFLGDKEIIQLNALLGEEEALFSADDFHLLDAPQDADIYNGAYAQNFHIIKEVIQHNKHIEKLNTPQTVIDGPQTILTSKQMLRISYLNQYHSKKTKLVLPYKLSYSAKDEKFRLIGITKLDSGKFVKIIVNLSRVYRTQVIESTFPNDIDAADIIQKNKQSQPIVLQIWGKRNALERCMLEFASWEKITSYDEAQDCYFTKIFYDKDEETELLIRILGFGPAVRVIEPAHLRAQIKERIQKQKQLSRKNKLS